MCTLRYPSALGAGLLALVTAGCTLYAPPEGPDVAFIGPDEQIAEAANSYVFIERIDGDPVTWTRKPPKRLRSPRSEYAVPISPGEHEIRIRACAVPEIGSHRCVLARLQVVIAPQEDYRIHAQFNEQLDAVNLWVQGSTETPMGSGAKSVEILPCSLLLAYTPLQPHIPCDKLDVIDVFFEPE